MIRWPKNFWPFFKALLFSVGIVLPFYAPDSADARCGCQRRFMFDQISPSDAVTGFHPDVHPTPIQWSSLACVAHLRPQTWAARLAGDLIGVWTALTSTSSKRSPCAHCPSNPDSPNERCRGPFCSGDVPPTAIPVSTCVPVNNESASLLGANELRDNDPSPRCIEKNICFQPSCCLDSIFHPPRST